MELLFESRLDIRAVEGKMVAVQGTPTLHPEPVLSPSRNDVADGSGMSIYGSVLYDGGRYRMWYQAWPRDWDGQDTRWVGYAESDDGIAWRKPRLTLVDTGGEPNNLVDLNLHCPSVFIDPTAPPGHRYRATGYAGAGVVATAGHVTERRGYYTAHSSDGLKWALDGPAPRWDSGDVITSIWHPQQQRGITALKFTPRVGSIPRRSIWNAEFRDGAWSDAHSALIPDEFDDICALSRGFVSGDYYGMGMMPAGQGTVGFVWQFRHTLPRTAGRETGVFGSNDVTLAYQSGPRDRWLHATGRKDFLCHGTLPWNDGGISTSAGPITIGDEQRLYVCGVTRSHGWYLNNQWQRIDRWKKELAQQGIARIGYASWPKDRLFGFRADPEGILTLDVGEVTAASELRLNCQTEPGGSVRVELADRPGYGLADAVALEGDHLAGVVRWQTGATIPPQPGQRVSARIHLEKASVYAYEVRPAS